MTYHGIIIAESLEDKNILAEVKLLSSREGNNGAWHMGKVEVPEEKMQLFAQNLSHVIKSDGHWYAHFYPDDPLSQILIVVFHQKVLVTNKKNPKDAVEYGLSHGFPKEQLDFVPQSVSEEKW